MNNEQLSELFFLNAMVSDPINYDSQDDKQAVPQPAEDGANPLSWLFKALDWLHESTRRTRVVLPSA